MFRVAQHILSNGGVCGGGGGRYKNDLQLFKLMAKQSILFKERTRLQNS